MDFLGRVCSTSHISRKLAQSGEWNEGRPQRRSSENEALCTYGVGSKGQNCAPHHNYIPRFHGRMWVLFFQALPSAAPVLCAFLGGIVVSARAKFFPIFYLFQAAHFCFPL